MQRGARFFEKQCFPCSVALVLGRGGGASCRPGCYFFNGRSCLGLWVVLGRSWGGLGLMKGR